MFFSKDNGSVKQKLLNKRLLIYNLLLVCWGKKIVLIQNEQGLILLNVCDSDHCDHVHHDPDPHEQVLTEFEHP